MSDDPRDYSKDAVLARLRRRTAPPGGRIRVLAAWILDAGALLTAGYAVLNGLQTNAFETASNLTGMSFTIVLAGTGSIPLFVIARFARSAPTPLGWVYILTAMAATGVVTFAFV